MGEDIAYGMGTLVALPYEQAIERITAALKDQGFGILTTIDVKQTIRQKLDKDFRKYIILGACNPQLSHQLLTTDLNIGLLLPCNVIVYEEGDQSVVSILDPIRMIEVANHPDLEYVARQAKEKLERALETLQQT